MKSLIRSLRPRVAKTVVNKNYTAVGFMRLVLTTVLSYLATHGSAPASFGTDYHAGHALISSVDLPYAALDIASTVPHAPDLEALCGSTGIINVGVCGKHIVLKYKWLVRARASRVAAAASIQHSASSHGVAAASPVNPVRLPHALHLLTPPPSHHMRRHMQGLRPSAHDAKTDMAYVLNVPDLLQMSEDAFTDRIADIAAFMVSIQCLGITAAALLIWLDNWWINLSSIIKLSGRAKVRVRLAQSSTPPGVCINRGEANPVPSKHTQRVPTHPTSRTVAATNDRPNQRLHMVPPIKPRIPTGANWDC